MKKYFWYIVWSVALLVALYWIISDGAPMIIGSFQKILNLDGQWYEWDFLVSFGLLAFIVLLFLGMAIGLFIFVYPKTWENMFGPPSKEAEQQFIDDCNRTGWFQ